MQIKSIILAVASAMALSTGAFAAVDSSGYDQFAHVRLLDPGSGIVVAMDTPDILLFAPAAAGVEFLAANAIENNLGIGLHNPASFDTGDPALFLLQKGDHQVLANGNIVLGALDDGGGGDCIAPAMSFIKLDTTLLGADTADPAAFCPASTLGIASPS